MKVIGLIGMIGSGKDAVKEYLEEKHGYRTVHMGDIVREVAEQREQVPDRDTLDSIQKEFTEKHGMDYWIQEVIRRIEKGGFEKAIINGIRRPADASVPKERFGRDMILIKVDADPRIRFERMAKRARPGDPKNFAEFERQEKEQFRLFGLEETLKRVDCTVTNNGTLEELHEQVDRLLKKTGFD